MQVIVFKGGNKFVKCYFLFTFKIKFIGKCFRLIKFPILLGREINKFNIYLK